VTSLEKRTANYVSTVFIDFNEDWQMKLFHE
jgi:hypothetical protein